LKQSNVLSPLVFNFALENSIRRIQVNQDGLKLNGTHQLLDYVDDINILGGSLRTIKNAEILVVVSKEIGLEVNADKTRYMVMLRDQHTVRSNIIKMDNISFEMVKECEYLGS